MEIIISFTGTQSGMTDKQQSVVKGILHGCYVSGARKVHHGMCIGADNQFHNLAVEIGFTIFGHPGLNKFRKVWNRADVKCDITYPEKYFLDRNLDIVNSGTILIATPKGFKEETRSGTWATIRCAKRLHKEIYIVWPNGNTEYIKG